MGVIGDEAPREFEATLVPECDVDEHDIRPKRRSLSQRVRTRRRDPRNREPFSLEERSSRPQEASIVVDDQTADGHPASVAGISSRRIAASRNQESSASSAPGSRLASRPPGLIAVIVPIDHTTSLVSES